jgi:peptidoglycan/xylan/chitin deacetylase (PgdA/CDA1 family)
MHCAGVLSQPRHCDQLRRPGTLAQARVLFMSQFISLALLLMALPAAAAAPSCPGRPDALGTARVLAVDAATSPRVGRKQFPATLPLGPKELVLTFDDGPWPTTTPAVLKALRAECVRATFFLLGRNVQSHPELARRELAEGHSFGHHSFSHPLLNHMAPEAAMSEIDKGIRADEAALGATAQAHPTSPFFRFPGFASTPALLQRLEARGMVVFGADIWASDWLAQTPEEELKLVLGRIEKADHGILLLHDTRAQTARMLPALLRELKARGYSIVHVVPAGAGRPRE